MFESVNGVCEIDIRRGARSRSDAVPALVIEVPHGATRTLDYDLLRSKLQGDIAADLVDFFHVNTDAGAPELASAIAALLISTHPECVVMIVRSLIPRTFIDCNRVIGPTGASEPGMTPGVPPWITHPHDLALLTSMHRAYTALATRAIRTACDAGGRALLLHTYAPRTVDVQVDESIVANIRHAYEPGVVTTWPLRPEIDVIGRALDGALLVDSRLLADLVQTFAGAGIEVADGRTYPVHPSTCAFEHTLRYPAQTLCVEVRRDLLAAPFAPFKQMTIGAERVQRIAAPFAAVLERWLDQRPVSPHPSHHSG